MAPTVWLEFSELRTLTEASSWPFQSILQISLLLFSSPLQQAYASQISVIQAIHDLERRTWSRLNPVSHFHDGARYLTISKTFGIMEPFASFDNASLTQPGCQQRQMKQSWAMDNLGRNCPLLQVS